MSKFLLAFILIVSVASCSKTSTTIVPGNVPPPDHTIDSSTINIYIGKCYINLLGRKPVGNEQSMALATLRTHNFSVDDRKQFLQTLFTKAEYNRNLFTNADNQYLRNIDTTTIQAQLDEFNYLLTQPQYSSIYDQLHYEIPRLDTLQNLINYMNAGVLDYKGMLKHIVSNYFYDQINMGTENFVVSTYQNFLFRYPSVSELANGETMVNGLTAQVFFQTGQSKQNYIDIFFNSTDYYEGQVRFLFKEYLFRDPTSAEIGLYSGTYKTGDYKQMELAIFSLDEVAGIH